MKHTLWWAGLVVLGCTHAKEEERPPQRETPPRQTAPPEAPPRKAPAPRKDTSKPQDERPAAEEGRPQLSMSPEGLMQPDGPRRIQDALIERGFLDGAHRSGALDDETSAALRKFQAHEGLAKTGAPDRETVRKLGLSISDVFKK